MFLRKMMKNSKNELQFFNGAQNTDITVKWELNYNRQCDVLNAECIHSGKIDL